MGTRELPESDAYTELKLLSDKDKIGLAGYFKGSSSDCNRRCCGAECSVVLGKQIHLFSPSCIATRQGCYEEQCVNACKVV